MPTRNVNLTDDQDAFVEKMVKAGKYQNASEMVRDALRGLQQRWKEDELKLTILRKQIKAGITALDRGDFTEVEDADLDSSLDKLAEVDPSRKSGGALHRLHCFCPEFDGACEVQRRVPTDWIIEPIDVSGYGSFSLAS